MVYEIDPAITKRSKHRNISKGHSQQTSAWTKTTNVDAVASQQPSKHLPPKEEHKIRQLSLSPSLHEDSSSPSDCNQDQEVFSEASEETPFEGRTPDSDATDLHPSSPTEDFSSYVQMVARMAKSLKLDIEQLPPPTEDLVFGNIN